MNSSNETVQEKSLKASEVNTAAQIEKNTNTDPKRAQSKVERGVQNSEVSKMKSAFLILIGEWKLFSEIPKSCCKKNHQQINPDHVLEGTMVNEVAVLDWMAQSEEPGTEPKAMWSQPNGDFWKGMGILKAESFSEVKDLN